MNTIYFEEKGAELLKRLGITKAEFARRMGIQKQNVNVLFKTKNLQTIHKAATVLNVPFELLIGYTSEPDIEKMPIILPDDEYIPIDRGPFGDIYDDFKGRPKEAFWFLIDHQEGDLQGVFFRKGIGEIDLVWGDESCGVCHILLKHINDKDFPTVNHMIQSISDIVKNGHSCQENPDVAVLKKDGFIVVIRKNYRIKGKKPESKNWILTAYSKESSAATRAPLDND